MNVLKRCSLRSMKENRKRTAVTVIGIILATALITAVACLAVSFRVSLIEFEKQQNGDFHYHFVNVEPENLKYFENNLQIEKYSFTGKLGYAVLEGCQNPDKPFLYITAMGEEAESALSLSLVVGRMPENGSELVVGRHTGSNGLVEIKVGDQLTVSLGERLSDDGHILTQWNPYHGDEETFRPETEKTFTVVGIIERPNEGVEPVTAPGYSAFTRLEDQEQITAADVYASYTKKALRHRDQVTAGILGVPEKLYVYSREGGIWESITEEEAQLIERFAGTVQENYWLLKWEMMLFSSGVMKMMYAMSAVAVAVIVVTGVFCIRNSFVISLTEKMRLYGRLSSVGTTAAQKRRLVYYEAGFLCMIGIPLGVAGGLAASVILVKGVSFLVLEAMQFELVFGVSVPMILLAAVLAAVTVFLSARGSARRAAKISPISAICAHDTIKLGKHISCPGWIESLFGIGGKIAYKNLRRARVKYRTTVVSIVVSVAIFIGMTTFVDLMSLAAGSSFGRQPYQLSAGIYQWKFYDDALAITQMEGVEEGEIVRKARLAVERRQIPYTAGWKGENADGAEEVRITVCSLGEEAYVRYCKKAGVSPEEARGKALVIADYYMENTMDGKTYIEEGNIAEFKPGDILFGTGESSGARIEILKQTTAKPMHLSDLSYSNILLIVDDEFMDSARGLLKDDDMTVYVKCQDADVIEQRIRNELQLQHFTVTNYKAFYRSQNSMFLVVAIFLYGFLAVVALIGITNVFNTITTNMELRAPEFAMLRSVGMTGREFRRMIWLESVFYAGKALCIGIPAGLVISVLFHRGLGERFVTDFRVPWTGILVSAASVALLLYIIMRYSMAKINKRNIIDTIRNENI